jgi:hypothetical protein
MTSIHDVAAELEQTVYSLQKYIIGQKNEEKELIKEPMKEKELIKEKEKELESPLSYFLQIHAKDKDKLFWAFYIMLRGEDDYKYLKTKFVVEKEIKISAVETMHKMSNVFKQHKLNKGRIETELSGDAALTLEGFFGLCIIHNVYAMFIKRNCYFELYGVGDEESPYLVEEVEGGLGIHVFKTGAASNEMANGIRKTKWRMENVLAPIKSISSYTHAELLEIYNKVASAAINTNINANANVKVTSEKKTKQFLYDRICEYLN